MSAVAAWELSGTESVGDSEQDAARHRIWRNHQHYVRGYVIVAVDDDGPLGVVENSFSMDCSRTEVRLWRERKDCYEGRKSAENYRDYYNAPERNRGVTFEVYDIEDPACPVLLDFVRYEQQANAGGPGKYDTRNLKIVPVVRAKLFLTEPRRD